MLSGPILYIRFLSQKTMQPDPFQFGLWQIVIPDSEMMLQVGVPGDLQEKKSWNEASKATTRKM